MTTDLTRPALLSVEGVSKTFTRGRREVIALAEASMAVGHNEFLTILGPSGCGKSTLLHIIGGFETATTGVVRVDGHPVRGPGRDRGMVFQQATLFPWWTIAKNVGWPMKTGGADQGTITSRTAELLDLVGLGKFGDSYPGELSGGMQQRAALARTLALQPQLLLMDEPFGALDAQTRELMQEELNRIWQRTGTTVVFITHDINEAVFLGDRVLVMSARPGRIIESLPVDLARPRDPEIKNGEQMRDYHAHLWELIRVQQHAAPTAAASG